MYGAGPARQPANAPVRARSINKALDEVRRLKKIRVGNGMAQQSMGGIPLIDVRPKDVLVARVTGAHDAAGGYPWVGLYRDRITKAYVVLTGYDDGGGLDLLYEANDSALAAGDVVRMYRDPYSGDWIGWLLSCPAAGAT